MNSLQEAEYEAEARRILAISDNIHLFVTRVANDTGLSEGDILGPSKGPHIVAARRLCMWLARQGGCGYDVIARELGVCRSTVRYGISEAKRSMKKSYKASMR